MTDSAIVVMYVCMLVFDFAVLTGTTWLVINHAWSPWWFVLTMFVCMGSAPSGIIKLVVAKAEGEKT